MLVIQFAKLFHRSRKLRGLDFPLCRSALGGVQTNFSSVRLVNRHGTAPCSHGLKGQRATFLLAVHIKTRVSQCALFVRHHILQCSRCFRRKDDACRRVAYRSSSSPFELVVPHGFDPCFRGYRPRALATRRRDKMVRLAGNDPAASAMSKRRSASELKTLVLRPWIEHGQCRYVKPMLSH